MSKYITFQEAYNIVKNLKLINKMLRISYLKKNKIFSILNEYLKKF